MTTFTSTIPTIAPGDTTNVPTNLAIYRDALKALSEPWTSYTPVWTATTTNPTIGNGVLVGHYRQVGKDVAFWISLTIGSTTNPGSGVYQLTLPVAPFSGHPAHFDVVFTDVSTGTFYRGITVQLSGSRVSLTYDSSAAGGAVSGLGSTTPVVPAAGDIYEITGSYEAA